MAIDNVSTDEIITEILNITGYTSSTTAPWASDANLIVKINLAAHRIPQKVRTVAKQNTVPHSGMPMWFTTIDSGTGAGVGNFVVTSGTTTSSLPADFDVPISLFDLTHERFIEITRASQRKWYKNLRLAQAGPTESAHVTGLGGGTQQVMRLLPDVATGITPSMRLEYFRLPTDVASGGSSFPDADYKYHYMWVLATVLDILRPDTPNYDRYKALEDEMLLQMAVDSRMM